MSILSTISSLVTPSMLGQVASMLGTQTETVERGMNGAVPGLLAALLGATKRPEAQSAFATLLANDDPSRLDNFGDRLGQDGAQVASGGRDMLTSILGGGTLSQFTDKLQSVTGMPSSAASSLAGVAGSVIMGALGKVSKQTGTDASGMVDMLRNEADDIAKAMPPDFAKSFSGTGLLSGLEEHSSQFAAAAAKPAAGDASASAAAQTTRPVATPTPSAGRPWWQWALLAVIVLAILAWIFGLFGADEVGEATDAEAPAVAVDGTDVGVELQSALDSFGETLSSITDVSSAEAALPDLNATLETLSGVQEQVANLPEEARASISTMVDTAMPNLRDMVGQLMEGDVGAIIGPVVEQIMSALQNLG